MAVDSLRQLTTALAGRYTIERELGAGGMATVYAAQDVRHDRKVAVKVLRAELSAVLGGDRFLSEIKTTAALQHPHILPLFDSGDAAGQLFYVMPLVEGESLRSRLDHETQLPIAEALRIAREVAAALDYAHRHGVVHRDIKPENILLQDGNALVADFGIALAVSQAGGQRLTQTGMSLGTPAYMSPEQAIGERTIDARADIYALGAVTYEMLAGEPPFTGPTLQATLARVIAERPRSLTAQRPTVPAGIERAILQSLEKLPADRFATVRDFAAALSESEPAVSVASARAPRVRPSWALGLVALAVVLAATGIGWFLGRRSEAQRINSYPPSRLAVVGRRIGGTGAAAIQRQLAISPDGGALFYVALAADGHNPLVRQRLDAADPTPVAGVRSGTVAPLFSPDGRWFVGWASGEQQAYRYPIDGGPGEPVSLSSAGYTGWAQAVGGTIWWSPVSGGILRRALSDSGAERRDSLSRGIRLQQVLSDGRHVLAMEHADAQSGPVIVYDTRTGHQTPLMSAAVVEVRYAAGYIVYVLANGTLAAAPFDESKGRITGPTVSIGTDVSVTGTGIAQFAVAPNGTIAYIVEEPQALMLYDRTGASHVALEARHNYHGPRFSPDGRRIALDFNSTDGRDVWVYSMQDGALTRTTFDRDGHDVTWMPDGRAITWLSSRSGVEAIYRKAPGGTETAERLFVSAQLGFTGLWLRDASALVTVMYDMHPGSGSDIAVVGNQGRGPATPFASTEFEEGFPAVSPNARWLAFTSNQSGRAEVYARPLSGSGDQVQISLNGGTEAVWSPDGSQIFYRTVGEDVPQLMAARVRTDSAKPSAESRVPNPELTVLDRRALFPVADIIGTNPHANYDVSPDGKTFVMVRRNPATRIMVIQNLRALVRDAQASAGVK